MLHKEIGWLNRVSHTKPWGHQRSPLRGSGAPRCRGSEVPKRRGTEVTATPRLRHASLAARAVDVILHNKIGWLNRVGDSNPWGHHRSHQHAPHLPLGPKVSSQNDRLA